MKTTFKNRILALLLAIVMIVPMIPTFALPASAAAPTGTLSVAGLTVTYNKDAGNASSCTLNGTTITATAQSKSGMGSSNQTAGKTTVTFKNTGSSIATLTFSYTGSSVASITVDGATYDTVSGSVSKVLSSGATLVIVFSSSKGSLFSKSKATLTINDVAMSAEKNVTVNFMTPVNGSYSIDGNAVGTAGYSVTKKSTESFAAVATPVSGYNFFGWYNETTGTYLSYKASDSLTVTDNATVYPEFISNTTALFDVGGVTFYDLTKAGQHAASGKVKTIVLLNNGTVSGSHTIPKGVTLLVPFNSSNTLYTGEPECTSTFMNNKAWVQPTAYRTLTLAADANITVNGAISISAQHAASNGGKPYSGAPTGPVGWVKMLSGSQITLENGANLYAWGFIQGDGYITAKSGATVYENFQFTDFRGGSNLTQIAGDGLVFPINQYYVQNIEVPTRYDAGAKETLYTSAYASATVVGGAAPFIGQGGMFVVESGYIVKDYIEDKDRLQVDVYGDIEMSSMTVEVSIKVDSSSYILPITNNITINLNSGVTTAGQSIAMLPGVEMMIDKDAMLIVGTNSKEAINEYNTGGFHLVVYDSDEWSYGLDIESGEIVEGVQYAFGSSITGMYPLPYAPGRTYNRTAADLKDAVIDVNGKITVEGGLYTTMGGGCIKSSEGTGIIEMVSGSGPDFVTFQANGGTSLMIPMNSASLMNGDGSYLLTGPSLMDDTIPYTEPGTVFKYCSTHDCWYTGECEKCIVVPTTYDITFVVGDYSYTIEIEVGETPSYNGTAALTKAPIASDHYTFAGWATSENGAVVTIPAATEAATYYAVFTAEAHDKSVISGGKHYCSVCDYNVGSCTDVNKDHKCDVGREDIACHLGTLTQQAGQSATCGADGWKAYYKCSCGKFYADSQAVTLIGDSNALAAWKTGEGKIYAAGEHTPEADDGDCTTAIKCSVCGTVTTPAKAAHVAGEDDGNCTTAIKCVNCSKNAVEGKTHVDGDDKNHVCDNDGCIVDNITDHTGKAPVQENVVTATCTTAGKYDSVVYCSECNAEISRTNVPGEIDPNNHDWNDPTYTWSDNGKECTAERTCKRDGSHKETETVTDTGVVTTDPTCTTMGVTTYTANFTATWAETQTTTRNDVAALDHDWVITYTWSEDVTRCTAKRVCKRNSAHEEFETATASGEVTTPATCTEKGTTTYTATFTVSWAEVKTTTLQNVAVIPHSYTVKQSETKATCMATGTIIWKCSECTATTTETLPVDPANHTEKNTYVEDYSAPTCGADGYTGDTYCECGVKIVTGTTIPATGNHNYATEIARTAATCMAEGSVTMQCVCGATKVTTLVINKNNHTGQGITYQNKGANHDMICECGEVYYPGQAHSYNAAHTCVCGATNHTHDHYETDETTHQSICSCGAAIGTPEGHVIVQVSPGTCQYSARNKCEICEKSFTGEKDMNNHVTTSTNYTNITDTHHTIVHACCQAVIETVPHNKDKYAFEGNCQNSARYQCSCEKEYFGVKNPNVHAAGNTIRYKDIEGATHTVYHPCCQEVIETVAHTFVRVENTNKYACVCGAEEEIALPEVEVIDIKNSLTNDDPDLTFALNFAIKDLANLDEAYLEKVLEIYGDYYTDYVLTIEGLTDASVTFNANGGADGYLAGQYDAWSENWVSVPFDDVTIMNGESLYIMEYAASMMGQSGLRFTLAEIAEIVQNFDCGVYFTPEFLNANPNLKVTLELKIFTEDAEGNKTDDISVATRTFELGNVAAIVVADGKQTEYYASLTAAYNGAEAGDTIVMLKDATLTSKLIVAKDITIDGNGHSIIANHTAFILEISSDCEFKNITLNTNNKAKGVKIASGNVVFDNVTIPNSNKSDALTVQGTLLIKNYFSVASTYSIMDASRGVVTVAPGTVFDIENWRATASPAKCDLKNALNTSGESFFTAYSSTTYYQNITSSTPLSLNGLTLLKDVTLNFNKTLTGTTTINLNGNDLTVADGKVFTVNGSLVFNGQGNVNGNFVLATESATIVAPAGLDVTTTVGCRKVVYENGVYSTAINHTPGAPADCKNDQTCTECGEVLDTAKGHTPGAPADCENDQTCTECGEVLDTATGHNWQLDGYTNKGANHSVNYVCANDASHTYSDNGIAHNYIYNPTSNQYVCVCGAVDVVELPDVIVTDIKNTLTNDDPDLTFALNFAIKDLANLDEAYLEKVLEIYGDYYTDYVLTIEGLTDASVTFNANGDADGYLAGQYDAWSEYWVSVPFDDVTIMNGESLYIMEYAASMMGQSGLRFTLAEIAEIVQNFDCGVYFTPEFLAANPGLKVTLELKIFTEDAEGNKTDDISVATRTFELGNVAAIVVADGKQTEYYASLTDAYNGAEAGDTIVMLKDATLTGKLTVAKNITIDGNGHSIIANHTAFILETNSDCEFKNITLNTNNKAKGVKIASGNVVFDNVTIPNSNKSDALTVYGTLLIKNYFSVATTYTLLDARQGVVNVAPGTVFDIANWRANASPAKCDLKSALNTNGEPFFCGYNSTTYLTSITSTTSLNGLTLLKDVTLNFNKTLTGTTAINLNGNDLTVADGKVFTVNGSLVLNGEGTVVGQLILGNANATITSSATLNVASGVANYEVKYENGVYSLVMKSGWNNIDGEWYYVINGELATGITRVPYNTELGHGPNANDKASWESNPNSAYTDAETAMYVFDQNGKLVRMTGIVNDNGTTRYAVDGVIGWHVGFVKVDNDYYYFAGDKNGGGNLIKTGKVYATRDYNTGKSVGGKCIYFFAEDGKLLKNEGVAEVSGKLYFFDNENKLDSRSGIIETANGYIYVRSNFEVAVGKYWVTASKTNGCPIKGDKSYTFNENGILQNAIDPSINGFVTVGEDKYYYVDGEPYYAGLVEIEGDIYYINSQGKVVTGWYYVTKTNDFDYGTTKLYFNKDGVLQNVKNGIVEENNGFYYYEGNHIQYGAGVIKLEDGAYIYVKSNGQLATGEYWITNTNGYLESGKYNWGTDGKYYAD